MNRKKDRVGDAVAKAKAAAEKPGPGDKRLKSSINKDAYRKMLNDALRWPLSTRYAAELWRARVTVQQFESWQLHESGFAKDVWEELLKFWADRHNTNPEVIPAVLPVYFRKVEKLPQQKRGRPTPPAAKRKLREMLQALLALGWTEEDYRQPLIELLGFSNTPVQVLAYDPEFDDPAEQVAQPCSAPLPSEQLAGATCAHCGLALNGVRVVLMHAGQPPVQTHIGCHYRSLPPAQVRDGQTAFDPPTGLTYKLTNGQWLPLES